MDYEKYMAGFLTRSIIVRPSPLIIKEWQKSCTKMFLLNELTAAGTVMEFHHIPFYFYIRQIKKSPSICAAKIVNFYK